MPLAIEVSKTTFSSGEVSPELRVRADLAKAQTGLWFLENMVVLLEGGVTRRPGTLMVLPLDPTRTYAFIPFRFSGSGSNAYNIVIGGGVAQFILNKSVVVTAPGSITPYTVAVPYTDADLGGPGSTTPGVSNLRWAVSGNVVFLFCDGKAPATLTRNADNSWTFAALVTIPAFVPPQGGCLAPVDPENLDPLETIAVSATTGVITLSASPAFAGANATVPNGFQTPAHVGTVWRLDESNLSFIPEWVGNATVTVATGRLNSTTYGGSMANPANAFDGNNATAATQTAAQGGVGIQLATAAAVQTAAILLSQAYALAPVPMSLWLLATNTPGAAYAAPGTANVVQLGVTSFNAPASDGKMTINFTSADQITNYTYVWVWFATTQPASQVSIYEANFQGLTSTSTPTLYRYNGNVYQALNGGNTGVNPPVHTSGIVLSGPGGVQWLYRTRGYGFVLINSVQSATVATATVIEQLPDSILQQPTSNWWPSAWDGAKGWPNRGKIMRDSLVIGRQDKFWISQPGTFSNWDVGTDPTSSQAAIAGRLVSPSGSLAWIESFMGGLYLGALTRDEEWVLVGQDILSAITVQNLSPYVSKQEGSAIHVPAEGEGGLITIDRTRSRALFMQLAYSYFMPQFAVEELTLSARHILGREGGGALGVSWQQDPNRIGWYWTRNGLLAGNTLMRDQQINGWHRHPQHAPTSSKVINIATIPANDEGMSWTYLLVQRSINGVPQLFVELLQPFFQPQDPDNPTAAGAFFVDCGSSYSFAAPVTQIGGLSYLAGQEVAINADGCEYRNPDSSRVVVPANGTITLTRPTLSGCIGLPIKYRARLLPLDLTIAGKSTVGEKQKANHLILQLVNSTGGTVSVNPDEGADIPAEPLVEMRALAGALTYGDPVPLFTGPFRTPAIEAPLGDQTVVEISGDDTMPFTLAGVAPDIIEQETD